MRSLRVLVAAAVVMCGVAASSFAAFSSVSRSTITASISFSGAGTIWAKASLSSGSGLTWTGVTPQVTDWKAASNYIVLFSTITQASVGIQIYTDNTASDASPRYPGLASNANGLVTNSSNTAVLPMCWRMVDTSTTTLTIVQGTSPTDGKTHLYSNELGGAASDFPCFFYMVNKGKLLDGDDYMTVKDSNRGMHYAEGDPNWGASASPDYIYVGASFLNALTGTPAVQYGATIRVELFTE